MRQYLQPATSGVFGEGVRAVTLVGPNRLPEPESLYAMAVQGRVETAVAVLTGTTVNMVVRLPDNGMEYYAWSEYSPGVDATISIYRGPTFSGGTEATVINRRLDATTTISALTNVTISDTGTLVYRKRIPAAKGAESRDPSPRIYPSGAVVLVVIEMGSTDTVGIAVDIVSVDVPIQVG